MSISTHRVKAKMVSITGVGHIQGHSLCERPIKRSPTSLQGQLTEDVYDDPLEDICTNNVLTVQLYKHVPEADLGNQKQEGRRRKSQ